MDIDVDIEKQIAQLQEGRLNGTIKPIGNISIDLTCCFIIKFD